ncbi:histidine kinase [Nonomuraea sp. NPDC049152]|uniref:sensor histidine kinase n=1 Tax=Nonomuraea sp. NPDC049152 TaxID=3154350 RepID=UPI00340B9CB4
MHMSRLIVVAWLIVYWVVLMSRNLAIAPTVAHALVVGPLLALQIVIFEMTARAARRGWWYVAAQVGLTYGPLAFLSGMWHVGNGFIVATLLLAVRHWVRWPLAIAAGVLAAAVHASLWPGLTVADVVFPFVVAINTGLAGFTLVHLSRLTDELRATRHELSRETLAQERLRAAVRLRGALGDHLSAITAALERARDHGEDAAHQIRGAADLARATLGKVREVAVGHRDTPVPSREPARPILMYGALVVTLTLHIWQTQANLGLHRLGFLPLLLAVAVLQFGIVAWGRHVRWMLPLQAVLSLAPMYVLGWEWGAIAGFVGVSFLLRVRPPWSFLLAGLVTVVVGTMRIPIEVAGGYDIPVVRIYWIAANLGMTISLYGAAKLADLVAELYESRERLVRMTVLTERLRLSRDVHDLMGFGLSAIALKCDVLLRTGHTRADLDGLIELTRRVRDESNAMARSSSDLSFPEELEAARAVLEAAGIEVDLQVSGHPPAALAPVLRESVTNLLRHSVAMHVTITCTPSRLTVVNDGVGPSAESGGLGLANLRERVTSAGGRLATELAGGRFTISAELA